MTRATLNRTEGSTSMVSANHQLSLVVDCDERGEFRAHVDNAMGRSIFDYDNLDPESGAPDPDGLWLITYGFMRHPRDTAGLLDYLQSMGIVGASATLVAS
ncbi:hypothetical protein [Acidovorax sp. sic0104]|uniref:hypothetical protein n=1 Tax=Acidovorax sp. sic0104 TaxID=2854784 RepID=UPI001C49620E|nr:hypothetical protein [Acidovorax sp. sic0104]MBV7542172.1 hypothetical protein [Acidovorax sp. sic0104]